MIQFVQRAVYLRTSLKTLMLFIFITAGVMTSYGASYYWVRGTGNWKDYSQHWAHTSGGQSFYDREPGSADDVFFDQYSFPFGGTLTIDANAATCKNMRWTQSNSTVIVSGQSGSLFINGSLALNQNINWNYTGVIYFNGTGREKTLTTAGCQLHRIYFESTGAEWILQDALLCNSISLMAGNLNTNGQTLHCQQDITIAGDTLELGSSDVHCMFWTNYMNSANTINPSYFDAGTSTIHCFQFTSIHQSYDHLEMISSSGHSMFISNNCSFEYAIFPVGATHFYQASDNLFRKARFNGTVILNGNSVFKQVTFRSDCFLNDYNTFDSVTFDNPGKTIYFESGKTQTFNYTFHINSTSQEKITLKSSAEGSSAILASSIPELCFDHLSLQDIAVTSNTAFKAGEHSDDLGNNSGCIFASCSSASTSWRSADVKNNTMRISEIYPNPVNSLACFEVENDHPVQLLIVIIDYAGRVCSEQGLTIDKGSSIITNDLSSYTAGIYFIKITDQRTGQIASGKVVKE